MPSSSANGYQAGYDKFVTFAGTRLNITQWDLEDGGDLVEITHSGHGGEQAFIPCVSRRNGTVTANFTSSQVINTNPGIKFGATGTVTVVCGSTNPANLKIIVEKVSYRSTVNGVVTYTFSYKSDAESGGTPSATMPT